MSALLAVALLALFQPSPVVAGDHPLATSNAFFLFSTYANDEENRKAAKEFIGLCDERLKSHPKDDQTLLYRANTFQKLVELGGVSPEETRRYKKAAVDDLSAAMSLGLSGHPQYAWRAELRCLVSCEGEELAAAVADARKALSLHPASAPYKKTLSGLLGRQGKREEADRVSSEAAAPAPKEDLDSWVLEMDRRASSHFLYGVFLQVSDLPAAIKELEQGIKICSDVLERVDDPFRKVSWYRERSRNRNSLSRLYARAADAVRAREAQALAIGDMDSAIEFGAKGAKTDPRWEARCSGPENCSQAALLSERGRRRCELSDVCSPEVFPAAVQDLRAAVRLDPAFHFELAQVLEKNGDALGAIASLRIFLAGAKTYNDRRAGGSMLDKLERPGGTIESWKPVAASSRVAQGVWREFNSTDAAALRGMRKALQEANVFNSGAGKPILAQRIVLTPVAPVDTYKFVELGPDLTVAQASEKVLADIKADDRIMSKLAEFGAR